MLDLIFCLVAKGNEPFFIALAKNPDKSGSQVACSQWELDQLSYPQSRGVQKKEHGVVPCGNGGCGVGWQQKALNLFFGKCFGQTLAAAGEVNGGEGVVFDQVFPEQEGKKRF